MRRRLAITLCLVLAVGVAVGVVAIRTLDGDEHARTAESPEQLVPEPTATPVPYRTPTPTPLRDPGITAISAAGSEDVWIALGPQLLHTSDDGKTWEQTYLFALGILSLSFVSGRTGWALSAEELLRTGDGGQTWETVYDTPTASAGLWPHTVRFIDEQFGWLNIGAEMLASRDGGRSWAQIVNPCTTHTYPVSSFSSPAEGWLVCGGQPATAMQMKALYRTTDGGQIWERLLEHQNSRTPTAVMYQLPWSGHLHDVFALDRWRVWMSVGRGTIWATEDGWQTGNWVSVDNPTDTGFWDVVFLDADRGYVLHGGGISQLLRTRDGGASWCEMYEAPALEGYDNYVVC
jgi:photosystem II stability/assembly factor-like uncharacterized protein